MTIISWSDHDNTDRVNTDPVTIVVSIQKI